VRPHLLPVLLCAAAALVACEETQAPPVAQQSILPDSAEQMLFGVHFFLTDGGVRRAELFADTAYMYDQNTRTELRTVKTNFFDATGKENATLTSREGSYSFRLNTMEGRGNVVVVTPEGRRLETEQLRYDPARDEISSDSAFTLTEPDRVTSGIGFTSDPDMNNIHVLRALKTSGQAVTIPKR
jgi:lipopolysaccharide export system protein LptC